jgi:hypothetical protein
MAPINALMCWRPTVPDCGALQCLTGYAAVVGACTRVRYVPCVHAGALYPLLTAVDLA